MRARPTDLVSVYRGTTTTDEGDVVDANDTAVHTGVPVSIAQSSRRSQPHNEQTPRLVRRYQGRAGITADIQRYDRLKDSGGRWYLVDATELSTRLPGYPQDLMFDLRSFDDGTPINAGIASN